MDLARIFKWISGFTSRTYRMRPGSLVTAGGRYDRVRLLAVAKKLGRKSFIQRFPEPVLVGKGVHIGDVSTINTQGTKMFVQERHDPDERALLHAIFPLRPASGDDGEETVRSVVGRDPCCDLLLNDHTISARHAEIITRDGGHFVQDTCSTNGTFLDGLRIEYPDRIPIYPGDRLRFGRYNFVFESPELLYERLTRKPIEKDHTVGVFQIKDDNDPTREAERELLDLDVTEYGAEPMIPRDSDKPRRDS